MKVTTVFCIMVAVLAAACSGPSAEEFFARAQEAQKVNNFSAAIDDYSALLREHPNSLLAESSLFMIATIYNNDLREHQKAIDTYRQYVGQFPDGEKVPTAMFLIGYLYNNELHHLDSAAAAYRRFLEKYPNHEMALSAQFELDNLGKSPEELLPKQVATETSKNPPGTAEKKARDK